MEPKADLDVQIILNVHRKKRHKHSHCLLLKITEGVGLPGLDILM